MRYAIISAEAMCIVFSFVILYGNFFVASLKNDRKRLFGLLLILNTIALVSDMVSWILDGTQTQLFLLGLTTFLSIELSFAISAVFVLYVYVYISGERNISPLIYRIMIFFCAAAIIVVGFACIHGDIYSFENGHYIVGQYYFVYLIANFVCIGFGLIIFIHAIRYLDRKDAFAAISYVLIPIITMIINGYIQDFSFVYPAITVSLVLVYVVMQSDHEESLIRQDREKAVQMTHDELTGLLNRRAYVEALETYAKEEGKVGVIFSDINGLKYVNDHKGHEAGDALIKEYAEFLTGLFRKEEIYRISGDEFVLLLPDVPETLLDERLRVAREILMTYEVPLAALGSDYGDKAGIEELVKDAEDQMYKEKQIFYGEYPQFRR